MCCSALENLEVGGWAGLMMENLGNLENNGNLEGEEVGGVPPENCFFRMEGPGQGQLMGLIGRASQWLGSAPAHNAAGRVHKCSGECGRCLWLPACGRLQEPVSLHELPVPHAVLESSDGGLKHIAATHGGRQAARASQVACPCPLFCTGAESSDVGLKA